MGQLVRGQQPTSQPTQGKQVSPERGQMCTEEHDFEDSGPLIYVKGHMTLEVVKTK